MRVVHELILTAYYQLRLKGSFQRQDRQREGGGEREKEHAKEEAGKEKKTPPSQIRITILVQFYISQKSNFKDKGS